MDRRSAKEGPAVTESPVRIDLGGVPLEGDLAIPSKARGVVLFAHGSGSGRHSPRNRAVAEVLRRNGLATLLFDLLTVDEEAGEERGGMLRFDIDLLAARLGGVTDWLRSRLETRGLPVGYFGASTGAGAALVAATQKADQVDAVVSRGGRPDLAGPALARVRTPTLLLVGGDDRNVIGLNKQALALLGCREKELVIIPGASHLFEEPGTLEEVARLASAWFTEHLGWAADDPNARRAEVGNAW